MPGFLKFQIVSRTEMPPKALKYVCQVIDCGCQLQSLKALISHMSLQHSDNKRLNLNCSIDECFYLYNSVETFRKHLRINHLCHWENAAYPVDDAHTDESVLSANDDLYDGGSCNATREPEFFSNRSSWDGFLNELAKHVAFLRIKITESYMLPKSVAQGIFEDIKTVFDTFQHNFTSLVKCRLAQIVSDDSLLPQILGDDSIFDVVFNKCSSDYLYDKYLAENLKMNLPVACQAVVAATTDSLTVNNLAANAVDANPDVSAFSTEVEISKDAALEYHYVPILVTLKNYLEQPDVWASCHQPCPTDGMLRNYTDGEIHTNSSHNGDKMFIRIHLYSDEVEICNPIGSRKTVHKLSTFYFLVGNIETKHWSSLTNIHLALLCKYKIIKTVGYKKVLEPLLADIKLLETEGINIQIDDRSYRVFGSVVTFSGDNLTSHAVAGFNECFSHGRVCRYCMAEKSSLTKLHCESSCQLRTPEGHSYHIKAIESDKTLSSVYGVKGVSCFSFVTDFSPVTFFPPDVMHDVLEGLMTVNITVVLHSFIRRKIITVKTFNQRLANFKFGQADSVDRFSPLPLDFLSKNKSISGKAVEKWCMFRLLCLIIGDIVPDDKFWQLHLLCKEICEIILAPAIDPTWLPHLELTISHHHKLLAEIAPLSFTPKVHFVTHYPRLILSFGPLRHLWVMRFEAAHQYFKQIARRVKNFKNISATLSRRYQAKKCYEHAANILLLSGTSIPCAQKSVKLSQLPIKLVQFLSQCSNVQVNISDAVYSVKVVVVNGHTFRVGCSVVYDVLGAEENLQFVSIRYILSLGNRWFVCGILSSASSFNAHLHAQVIDAGGHWFAFHPGQNIDYQCLSVYNCIKTGQNVIILKHRVCRRGIE